MHGTRARRSARVHDGFVCEYMNHNEYTQQVQQGHPRRARHPLALEGHRNPDRSVTLAPLMELRSKRRLAHMIPVISHQCMTWDHSSVDLY